jgi:hypothetical protein
METFLNLVWLVITVAALWLWRFRWTVSRQDPEHSPRMQAVAMVCFLALLFPVISLTDDLHPETAVVDAASGKRNACLIAASASHVRTAPLSSGTHSAFGMTSGPYDIDGYIFFELVPKPRFHDPGSLSNSSSGRSPPISL